MILGNVGIPTGNPKEGGGCILLVETICLVGPCGSGFIRMYPSGRVPTHHTLLLICQHGFGIVCSSVTTSDMRSSAATQYFLLHQCPLSTATNILHCAVGSLLLLFHLIVTHWFSFQCCSRWCHCVAPPSAAPLPCLRITTNFFQADCCI